MISNFVFICYIGSLLHEAAFGFLPPPATSRFQSSNEKISFRTTSCNSKLFGPEEDFDEGKQNDDGAALAKQFYDQLKKREDLGDKTDKLSSSDDVAQPDEMPKKPKKFTGKPPEPTPSRNSDNGNTFFSASNSNNSVGGDPQTQRRTTPREQMMEREFNLVGRAEKAIPFQAGLAVAVAILYLYVGLSGGIQSGGDYDGLGNDDTIVEELMIPVPRDTEASYWL